MAGDPDAILAGLKRLIDALSFELVDLRTPKHPLEQTLPNAGAIQRRPFVPRLVYCALPLALGVIPLDQTYKLICVSDMSSKRFWQCVAESLELDDDLIKPENERLAIDAHHLRKFLPQSADQGKVIFCYLKYSNESFDGQVIRKPKPVPWRDGWWNDSSIAQDVHLAEAFDAQELNVRLNEETKSLDYSDDFLPTTRRKLLAGFYVLRQRVYESGLLSEPLHYLSETYLVYIFFTTIGRSKLDRRGEADRLDHIDWMVALRGRKWFREFMHNPHPEVASPSGLPGYKEISSQGIASFHQLLCDSIRHDRSQKYDGMHDFLQTSPYVLKIHISCWSPKSKANTPETILRTIGGRVWPFPFEDGNTYLIAYYKGKGVCKSCGHSFHHPDQDGLVSEEAMDLDALEEKFQGLEYDREVMALSYEVLTRAEADYYVHQQTSSVQAPDSGREDGRFRTASAVMNRLRWDVVHRATEYEVGYIDRFEKDLMWKALEKWEKHTEEEEFIPEHRIMQIRKSRNREVVWDRERRVDRT